MDCVQVPPQLACQRVLHSSLRGHSAFAYLPRSPLENLGLHDFHDHWLYMVHGWLRRPCHAVDKPMVIHWVSGPDDMHYWLSGVLHRCYLHHIVPSVS